MRAVGPLDVLVSALGKAESPTVAGPRYVCRLARLQATALCPGPKDHHCGRDLVQVGGYRSFQVGNLATTPGLKPRLLQPSDPLQNIYCGHHFAGGQRRFSRCGYPRLESLLVLAWDHRKEYLDLPSGPSAMRRRTGRWNNSVCAVPATGRCLAHYFESQCRCESQSRIPGVPEVRQIVLVVGLVLVSDHCD